MTYGDKVDFNKINIFVDGQYYCSTTWAKTCKEAISIYRRSHSTMGKVTARYAK